MYVHTRLRNKRGRLSEYLIPLISIFLSIVISSRVLPFTPWPLYTAPLDAALALLPFSHLMHMSISTSLRSSTFHLSRILRESFWTVRPKVCTLSPTISHACIASDGTSCLPSASLLDQGRRGAPLSTLPLSDCSRTAPFTKTKTETRRRGRR